MSAYGTPASDTGFRRKRDVEEYASRGKERDAAEREEAKARYEAKMAGKRYHKPLDGSETLTSARAATLDLSTQVGKVQLVPAGAGVGKRGRGAGFYCEACDLTFKDNLQWVEHQNSMQHLRNIGETGEVRKATAEEVHARIEAAWERLQARKEDGTFNLADRLDIRKREEDKEREERRMKRKEQSEKRRAEKEAATKVDYGDDVRIEGEHDEDDMMAMMGIKGFGTTKD